MKRQAIFLFLPIFLVFFVWGIQVGNNLEEELPLGAREQLNLEKNIKELPNGQKSILIFIVSRLDTKNPELLGVWLMSYMSTEPYATILGIYPSLLQNETDLNSYFDDTFRLRKQDGISLLDDTFLSKLNEMNIWFSGYLILDQEGFVEIVKLADGDINQANTSIDESNINQLLKSSDPSTPPLIKQILLLEQLCNKFTLVDALSDLQSIRDLFPHHISGNLDPDVLMRDWGHFIRTRNGSFCVFPQKDQLSQISK